MQGGAGNSWLGAWMHLCQVVKRGFVKSEPVVDGPLGDHVCFDFDEPMSDLTLQAQYWGTIGS